MTIQDDVAADREIVEPGTAPRVFSSLALRLALDSVAIVVALALAFLVRFGLGWFEVTEASPPTASFHLAASAMWLVGLVVALSVNRLYDEDTLIPGGGEVSRIVRSVVGAGAILTAFIFLTQSFYVSRSWFSLLIVFSVGLLSSERVVLRRALDSRRRSGRGRRPAILVGPMDDVEEWPFEKGYEFEVIRQVEPDGFAGFCASAREDPALRGAAVILRARGLDRDEFWRILLLAGSAQWSVFVHSPVRSVGRDRLTVRDLGGQTIVKVAPPTLGGMRNVQKRLFDLLLAVVLLIILSPILVVIALGVLFTSGFPVFYRQQRVGLDGRKFQIVKFRTMRAGGPDMDNAWTLPNDPRRTFTGRFLRRLSLDELPQLWNVVKGEMSLVGPRPERPALVGEFEEEMTWYRFRHRIRPGITGWAQSHGLRGDTSLDSRIEFDNWYIENWSVWLDLKILALTLGEVVRGRNAY